MEPLQTQQNLSNVDTNTLPTTPPLPKMAELSTDPSPVAATHPPSNQVFINPTPPSTTTQPTQQPQASELETLSPHQPGLTIKIRSELLSWFSRAVAILLTLQGLFGLYKSFTFLSVEVPLIEKGLATHQVSSGQVTSIAGKAITLTISTVLSLFFALQLGLWKPKVVRKLTMVFGIILFGINTFLHNYFASNTDNTIINDIGQLFDMLVVK